VVEDGPVLVGVSQVGVEPADAPPPWSGARTGSSPWPSWPGASSIGSELDRGPRWTAPRWRHSREWRREQRRRPGIPAAGAERRRLTDPPDDGQVWSQGPRRRWCCGSVRAKSRPTGRRGPTALHHGGEALLVSPPRHRAVRRRAPSPKASREKPRSRRPCVAVPDSETCASDPLGRASKPGASPRSNGLPRLHRGTIAAAEKRRSITTRADSWPAAARAPRRAAGAGWAQTQQVSPRYRYPATNRLASRPFTSS
jgi:hypothetical protein